jgi:predicted ester cyclase
MMSEANKKVIRRVVDEVLHAGDVAALDDLLAEDIVSHDPSEPNGEVRGLAAYRAMEEQWLAAWSDLRVTIDDIVAEGDRVVGRYTFRARYRGGLFGDAGVGTEVALAAIGIHRMEHGRIAEEWFSWDALGLMQQLGVTSLQPA